MKTEPLNHCGNSLELNVRGISISLIMTAETAETKNGKWKKKKENRP